MDRAGKYGCTSISGGIRPTKAVANVANRWYTEDGLATFAGQGTCAALRHHGHVVGVEIDTQDRRHSVGGGLRWAACRWSGRGRGAVGVDVERLVFLDNPAIVGYNGCFIFTI